MPDEESLASSSAAQKPLAAAKSKKGKKGGKGRQGKKADPQSLPTLQTSQADEAGKSRWQPPHRGALSARARRCSRMSLQPMMMLLYSARPGKQGQLLHLLQS